jgi:hypothetical protein
MNNVTKKLEDQISDKALYIWKNSREYFQADFCPPAIIIAGGCLAGEINDVDVFRLIADPKMNGFLDIDKIVAQTRNAITCAGGKWPLQVCNYSKTTLKELVDSFDFAHIQVGVQIENAGSLFPDVKCVYFSPNFVEARLLDTSFYTGTAYPLSSLIRASKYKERGALNKHEYIKSVISILADVVERGYHNYDDFKDQLDAVDLGLLSEELDGVKKSDLARLFELLQKDKIKVTLTNEN